MPKPLKHKLSALVAYMAFALSPAIAQAAPDDDFSLEELTKTEISSVSRRNESLSTVPAAAFVISADDIRRSGALALPDVLRMVPGIQVGQVDSGRYAVTARGFNGRFANKLQVLIDGRSIYNPFFSGVVWETDQIALEDIERIEVIRGAGAAMWGVNAVNGVINIISKPARSQQGGMLAGSAGTKGLGQIYARGGASLDADTFWKLSVQGRHAEPSRQAGNRQDSEDRLKNWLADFRFDRSLGAGSDISIWANAAESSLGDLFPSVLDSTQPATLRSVPLKQETSTQSLGARYRWLTNGGIESSLQSSLTSSATDFPGFISEQHVQFDIDYQGRYNVGRHDLLWGLSYRSISDDNSFANTNVITMRNWSYQQDIGGIFLHDDWTLLPNTLRLGIGARLDHTNLGGTGFSPNTTLMWTPTPTDTLWVKYSRAPRMPARGEQDVTLRAVYTPPSSAVPLPVFTISRPDNGQLRQENMEGVEFGYRGHLAQQLAFDASLYRYRYSHVVSTRLGNAYPVPLPIPSYYIQETIRTNDLGGWLSGAEISMDWLVIPSWRLQLSYTWTHIDMDDGGDSTARAQGVMNERATPRHTASLRSQWNMTKHQQFDAWLRASSGFYLPPWPYATEYRIPGYITLDLRYAHKITPDIEIAVSGRNLVGQRRVEYIGDYLPATPSQLAPSVFLSTVWKF